MNTRQVILAAATHIEREPDLFNYGSVCQPKDCGSPACAMGWIGFFGGLHHLDGRTALNEVSYKILGIPYWGDDVDGFESRMCKLTGNTYQWAASAIACARTLRVYADKYHPSTVTKMTDKEFIASLDLDRTMPAPPEGEIRSPEFT